MQVSIAGIPADVPEAVAAAARSRFYRAYTDVAQASGMSDPQLVIGPMEEPLAATGTPSPASSATRGVAAGRDDDLTTEQRARRYQAQRPRYEFNQLVLPEQISERLMTAIAAIRLRRRIYDDWGLRVIEPAPSTALNFHGPPGTGKTLAAHAIADRLGLPILMAGYAELESKFHGDGPKNVKAAFYAAEAQGAILLIDEADSLLSRRLTDVSQGSEQAINSMRSQIILCLDQFDGIVIFSTNLVENYDKAFESRIRHFEFPLPDEAGRLAIWQKLLVPTLPVMPDVDCSELVALTKGFNGRNVKGVIIAAAERAALANRHAVLAEDFRTAIEQARAAQDELGRRTGRLPTPEERAAIERGLAEEATDPRQPAMRH